MRWFVDLVVRRSYFVVGFVDRELQVPSIGTFVYLGIGTLPECEGKHCFQDAHSFYAAPDENEEPAYIALTEESLDMIADKDGLVGWLQTSHSAGSSEAQ